MWSRIDISAVFSWIDLYVFWVVDSLLFLCFNFRQFSCPTVSLFMIWGSFLVWSYYFWCEVFMYLCRYEFSLTLCVSLRVLHILKTCCHLKYTRLHFSSVSFFFITLCPHTKVSKNYTTQSGGEFRWIFHHDSLTPRHCTTHLIL